MKVSENRFQFYLKVKHSIHLFSIQFSSTNICEKSMEKKVKITWHPRKKLSSFSLMVKRSSLNLRECVGCSENCEKWEKHSWLLIGKKLLVIEFWKWLAKNNNVIGRKIKLIDFVKCNLQGNLSVKTIKIATRTQVEKKKEKKIN